MDSRLIGLLFIQMWQGITLSAALKDRTSAEKYLETYNYLGPKNPSEEIGRLVDKDPDEAYRQALMLFQQYANIKVTGVLDDQTKKYMSMGRCGVPDIINMGNLAKRKKRYALQGSRWHKNRITYKIENYPAYDLSVKEVDDIVDRAFKVWSTVSLLEFIKSGPDDNTDIHVRYEKYWHGDKFPFDGYGGSLAHAFFPEYGGDIHFDNNEIWTSGTDHGTNLFQVTVHEIGHSLGLAHSRNPDSLMAAFYKGYTPVFKLHDDDIQAIQVLYGIPENVNYGKTWTEPPVRISADVTPPCESIVFDAITTHREQDTIFTYAFFGKFYALIDGHGIANGWPRYIARDWPGLPSDLDAALYWPETHEEVKVNGDKYILVEKEPARTYFFKGHLYWRYQNRELMPGYPKPIMYGFRGVPSYIDAAFVWSGNGLTYFIKGQYYYRYIRSRGVDYGYPLPLTVWRGLSSKVGAAFEWTGNYQTYFFSGQEYYKFSDSNFKVYSGYPRTVSKWWLGCPGPNQSLQEQSTNTTQLVDQSSEETIETIPKNNGDRANRSSYLQSNWSSCCTLLLLFVLKSLRLM